MSLPVLNRCCRCLSIETGCVIICILSFALCAGAASLGSWQLTGHRELDNEDNLILMSMVMFATLSAISNLGVLIGIGKRRPGYLQLSRLSNCVFILCLFLVAVVACLFSPTLKPYLDSAGYILLAIFLIAAGAAYSVYYLTVVNSMYTKLKQTYCDSIIPI